MMGLIRTCSRRQSRCGRLAARCERSGTIRLRGIQRAILSLRALVWILAALPAVGSSESMQDDPILAALEAQRIELREQRTLIAEQQTALAELRLAVARLREDDLRSDGESLQSETARPATGQIVANDGDGDRPEVATGSQIKADADEARKDDPAEAPLEEIVGAVRIPGTRAAFKLGGFVKSRVIAGLDPVGDDNQFIVGSIPVGGAPEVEAKTSITASESRLSVDFREPTPVGQLRAFIEADFSEGGNAFRLRHAFGQWNRMLVGQTWSAMVDPEAAPEEVDFDGLNGRINLRHAQIRFIPVVGRSYQFQLSIEDPGPDVQGGAGASRLPDFVASARFNKGEDLHLKIGALLRQIRAHEEVSNIERNELGWGLSVSGHWDIDGAARDKVMFQVSGGSGIGHYINDLRTVGDFDAIFDPATDELELIDVIAAYVSGQHWWSETMRSNLTLGYVALDNPSFVDPGAYKRTLRASVNLLWMPTSRVDIGSEVLWGMRENEDGSDGDATQAQLAVKYRF